MKRIARIDVLGFINLRILLYLALVLLFVSVPRVGLTADTVEFQFDQHTWKHRLIVIYSDSEHSDTYLKQLRLFQGHTDGFSDRDLLLISSFSDSKAFIQEYPNASPNVTGQKSARRINKRFRIQNAGFRVFLIGKDGTKKLHSYRPISVGKLFQTIDAMPMRRREIRTNS